MNRVALALSCSTECICLFNCWPPHAPAHSPFHRPLIAALPPHPAALPLQHWVYLSLQVLVTACPCALVLSTPATVVCALARAAQVGVLFKGGAALESMSRVSASKPCTRFCPLAESHGQVCALRRVGLWSSAGASASHALFICWQCALQVGVVTFDKTGTLTKGQFQVVDCQVRAGRAPFVVAPPLGLLRTSEKRGGWMPPRARSRWWNAR